jgi:uncharacterized protein YyaL (SSP411 family)
LSNRLAQEKSPYLLQHADNPVDWFPWGDEALAKAKDENKPIFLSIGYATCHWCHVMAHESFEDDQVARLLNEKWVPIKVDREERPDLDQVYMAACQALTGQGGWPLSAFLTPEGKPFYAGTYFPKTSRFGRPGFIDLIEQLAAKWESDREIVTKAADQLTQALQDPAEMFSPGPKPGEDALERGYQQMARSYDPRYGGFGSAPKFPTPHNLNFLLRYNYRRQEPHALEMVERTLTAMRHGGIFDHLGLGFHRYSVDEKWLVPHFEKMLYDQALLALAYAETYQAAGKDIFGHVVEEIMTYVLRDMTDPGGGFYAAEDADSEGREGIYYCWTPDQVNQAIGPELGQVFCQYYDITTNGNFEDGLSIPHISRPLNNVADELGLTVEELSRQLAEAAKKLYEVREQRIHPLKDDKIITSWNGLMIAAMARAGRILGRPDYIQAAGKAAGFILENLKSPQNGLLRRYRQGRADHDGFAEDYAYMVFGLIELYEAGFNLFHLTEAIRLTEKMLDLFWDTDSGGLFFSGRDNETLVARKKEIHDGATPSANSVAAMNLARLGRLTGRTDFENKADDLMTVFSRMTMEYPMAHTHMLMAVDFAIGPTAEIVVVGNPDDDAARDMINAVHRRFLPHSVLLNKPDGPKAETLARAAEFTRDLTRVDARPTLYLCRDFACQRPVTTAQEAENLLSS